MKLNQKGALDMMLVIALVIVLVVGGFVLVRISESDDADDVANTSQVTESVAEDMLDETAPNEAATEDEEVEAAPDGYEYATVGEFKYLVPTDELWAVTGSTQPTSELELQFDTTINMVFDESDNRWEVSSDYTGDTQPGESLATNVPPKTNDNGIEVYTILELASEPGICTQESFIFFNNGTAYVIDTVNKCSGLISTYEGVGGSELDSTQTAERLDVILSSIQQS